MKKQLLIIVLLLIFLANVSGCGTKKISEEKIYFFSNRFGGKHYTENSGTCLFENGEVKRLFRHYWFPRATHDGTKLVAAVSGTKKTIAIVDLKTGIEKRKALEHSPQDFCWFSNDFSKLLYIGYDVVSEKERIFNIYVHDLLTSNEDKLTNVKDVGSNIYSVSCSPDGKRIVYSVDKSRAYDSGRFVKIMDIETKTEQVIPFSAGNVAWSRNADIILLWGIYWDGDVRKFGSRTIVYNIKTKTYKKLEKPEEYFMESDYAFSPDGKKLAYVRHENNGRKTLWTMNIDGTDRKRLLNDKYHISKLSWTK